MDKLFPFSSKVEYNRFVYQDYPFELFGSCEPTSREVSANLTNWVRNLKDIDTEEPIDVIIVSTMEYDLSIQSTYFFLSKLGCKVRETYFPTDSLTIWDKCDILITANPKLLNNKPTDKISIKINTEYNKDCQSDYAFQTLEGFLNNEENILKLLERDV
jgi:hypothetical protein